MVFRIHLRGCVSVPVFGAFYCYACHFATVFPVAVGATVEAVLACPTWGWSYESGRGGVVEARAYGTIVRYIALTWCFLSSSSENLLVLSAKTEAVVVAATEAPVGGVATLKAFFVANSCMWAKVGGVTVSVGGRPVLLLR